MRASIFTVYISDSGFLAGVKTFWSRGVSISLWSWRAGWQRVTNHSSMITSFLSWLLFIITLGIVSSFRVALLREKKWKPDAVFLWIIKFSFMKFLKTLSLAKLYLRLKLVFLLCDCKQSPRLGASFYHVKYQ